MPSLFLESYVDSLSILFLASRCYLHNDIDSLMTESLSKEIKNLNIERQEPEQLIVIFYKMDYYEPLKV